MSDHKELIKRLRGEGRKLQPQINYDAADALENSVPISDLEELANEYLQEGVDLMVPASNDYIAGMQDCANSFKNLIKQIRGE